jgi:hypothetical protein
VSNTPTPKAPENGIGKVNDEVAVGEDLEFQHKWWNFERGVWIFFTLVLIADLAGAFGRGPVAKTERRAPDNSVDLRYDRIQRVSTPSIFTVNFGPSAIHSGKVVLYVSDTLVKKLGAMRVIPSPESAIIGNSGLTYTLPASATPAAMQFELEPTAPGLFHLTLQVAGAKPVNVSIFVFP